MKKDRKNEIEDLQEWLDHQYNPWHYVGTGRVPRPVSKLSNYPSLLIIIGILNLFSIIMYCIFSEITWNSLLTLIIPLFISIGLIIRGIQKHSHTRARNKKP